MSLQAEWVAVDWGTSNVRAWGIAADGSRAFATSSDKGMGRLTPAEYPAVLRWPARRWLAEGEIIVCGMAGARQGWVEAPYLDTPADLHRLRPAPSRRLTPIQNWRYGFSPASASAKPAART